MGILFASWPHDIEGDENRQLFNLTFQEGRKFIENKYGRTSVLWFPILGNAQKRWNFGHDLFKYTVMACYRLHNWMMRIRNLDYDPSTDPNSLFVRYY